jgi:hypothetical protein
MSPMMNERTRWSARADCAVSERDDFDAATTLLRLTLKRQRMINLAAQDKNFSESITMPSDIYMILRRIEFIDDSAFDYNAFNVPGQNARTLQVENI